jgi:protein-S-isoprenylcysteine O-methyltransferase Ste14
MKATRKKLILWGVIAYLTVVLGPACLSGVMLGVSAFHITPEEKWEALSDGPYRPGQVIARHLVAAVTASLGLALMIGCPASVVFGLYLAIVALTTEPASSARGAQRASRNRQSTRRAEPPAFLFDEPAQPTPPPPPPRSRD